MWVAGTAGRLWVKGDTTLKEVVEALFFPCSLLLFLIKAIDSHAIPSYHNALRHNRTKARKSVS